MRFLSAIDGAITHMVSYLRFSQKPGLIRRCFSRERPRRPLLNAFPIRALCCVGFQVNACPPGTAPKASPRLYHAANTILQTKRAVPPDNVNVQLETFTLSGGTLSGRIYVRLICAGFSAELMQSILPGQKHCVHQSRQRLLLDGFRNLAFQRCRSERYSLLLVINFWHQFRNMDSE